MGRYASAAATFDSRPEEVDGTWGACSPLMTAPQKPPAGLRGQFQRRDVFERRKGPDGWILTAIEGKAQASRELRLAAPARDGSEDGRGVHPAFKRERDLPKASKRPADP